MPFRKHEHDDANLDKDSQGYKESQPGGSVYAQTIEVFRLFIEFINGGAGIYISGQPDRSLRTPLSGMVNIRLMASFAIYLFGIDRLDNKYHGVRGRFADSDISRHNL